MRPAGRLALGRFGSALLVSVVALLPFGAGAAQAVGERAAGSPTSTVVTPNWAGYVATGQGTVPTSFSSVTGTWTVPPANCSAGGSAGTYSTAWVGLGGWMTQRQEEVGTDTNCTAAGKPVYFAWFEIVPYLSYTVKGGKVLPGDTVTGLIKVLGPALVQLNISDQTQGWTFSRNITISPLDTTSADWIVESPVTCLRFVCNEANLANFGSVNMTAISATANGQSGTLNDPDWNVTPVELIPGQMTVPTLDPEATSSFRGAATSSAGATPGEVSSDGSSFSVQWSAKPTPPV